MAKEITDLAFKCNYCDGGEKALSFGFKLPCSPNNRMYNVNSKKLIWCTNDRCACRSDVENINNEYIAEKLCYESRILKNLKMYVGRTRDNKAKHFGKNLSVKNRLIVLTTLLPNTKEEERVVFGVFIVDKVEYNKNLQPDKEDGVYFDRKLGLVLNKEEAQHLKFWKFYKNRTNPNKILWGTNLYRKLTNAESISLLKAIRKIKQNKNDVEIIDEIIEKIKI